MAIHRYSGLAMIPFLLIAAVTGALLSFEHPLDRWLNPGLFAPRSAGAADPAAAVLVLERAHLNWVAIQYPVRTAPGENIVVAVAARSGPPLPFDQAFLDRGSGALVGTRQDRAGFDAAHLLRGVYVLHYTLLAGTIGRWVMGLTALSWLLSNLVGVYLTLPTRRPFWKCWRRCWTIRFDCPLPRLLLDIHRVSGLWLIAPLTVLAFTSLSMNFFDELFLPAVRAVSPPEPSPFDAPPPQPAPAPRLAPADRRAAAEAMARVREPGWRAAVYQVAPDRNLLGIRFTRSGTEAYRGLGPVTYWFDGATGRFVGEDSPYRDSTGEKLERALFPLHTGQMIGTPGIVLDLVLATATIEMCGTGLYLWLKRRRPRKAIRRAAALRAVRR